ncbi:uncharacterized protein LOC116249152 [Nymphaea colorata]|nr:uncharacterized protein LOC116249152 [Nymphaea colorata]
MKRSRSPRYSDRSDYEEYEAASSSSSHPPVREDGFQYDVFLNFRGPDTRKGFTSHLYQTLQDKGIHTFIDSEELEKGQKVKELFGYIERSQIFVPIFSKGYADSEWCLKEIAKMVECKRLIIPVFFDIEPRDVRGQSGPFELAFTRYVENDKTNKEEVRKWRNALIEAGEVSGYTLANTCVDEATEIKKIVTRILTEVNRAPLFIGATHPIGLDSRIAELVEVLDVEAHNDVKMVGIHGMGGIGKTTLARAVYNKLFLHFDACSFISDVREAAKQSKLVSLQEQLLRDVLKDEKVKVNDTAHGTGMIMDRIKHKKVLLVLDDVDSESQLGALVGSVDHFRPGSRIIITTRDKQVLIGPPTLRVKNVYEIKELDPAQALQLFSWHAFGKEEPPAEFANLSKEVAATAAGLPLALKIFGRHFLCQKTNKQREAMLKKLKKDQHKDIHERLKISFDALDKEEKIVFLDIACFFVGEQTSFATFMWEECELFPDLTIEVLMHKCLVNINQDTRAFEMHDHIRDMGRKIVEDESGSDPGMRSRLWKKDDILYVLPNKRGTEKIEAIDISCPSIDSVDVDAESFAGMSLLKDSVDVDVESFAGMSQLRMLRLGNVRLGGEYGHLPRTLKWLNWNPRYLDSLPSTLPLENIVVLDLSRSSITQVWNNHGYKETKVFGQLKVLNLSECRNLNICPDFTTMRHLEILDLLNCRKMTELHPSIGHLKSLTRLNLRWCFSLRGLPKEVWELTSLEELDISNCVQIIALPSQLVDSKSLKRPLLGKLKVMNLDSCVNLVICPDFTCMPNIEKLNFGCCFNMTNLHPSIGQLKSLTYLSLWGCQSLKELPEGVWQLTSLEEIDLSECSQIRALPSQLLYCKSLKRPLLDKLKVTGGGGSCSNHFSHAIREQVNETPETTIREQVNETPETTIRGRFQADRYEELSLRIVRALEGLPLAIKILASTLYNNGDAKDQWDEGMITMSLKGLRDDRIYTMLKVSYDRLTDSNQRSIFLDVACFFSGIDPETAIHIWDAFDRSERGEEGLLKLSMEASSSPSPLVSAFPFEYEVFLSFRGVDTRTTFTDHLYQALRRSGIHVFRDSEGLRAGDRIDDLLGVINRSEMFIPIFSSNYAHSIWCLKEIREIVKVASVGESKRLILPVFYDVTPQQVGDQKPPFEAAFRVHEQDEEVEAQTVMEWRKALKTASGFFAYECQGHHEARLVDEIVERVLQEVKSYPQDAVEQLVGIKKRANDVIKELDLNSKAARMVVIHGIGGLGKTTVGRAVYDEIKTRFQFHCFIEGISKKTAGPEGLVNIQRDLVFEISKDRRTICSTSEGTGMLRRLYGNKKVLIVLDDVDGVEQVQALAGKWAWFQQGSRIIVTTRDKGTLALPDWEKHKIYMLLTPLDEIESLQLFSWHAFGKKSPADGYEELSKRIVRALEGLPLAIKILASTLYNNGDAKDQWDEGMILRSLKGLRDDRLYTTLKVSYDRLTDSDQRSIFLDVACFFSGIDQETAIHIWDACGFSSRLSIKALIHKSLIKIINDKLEMPKILQEMGRRIVEEEPGTGPEWRSRLWKQQDIMDVLKQRKGTSKIEAIGLIKGNDKAEREEHDNVLINAPNHDDDTDSDDKRLVEAADFASMDRLRLLMINHVDLKGRCRRMPKRIKLLQWQRCPFKSLPPDFHLKEVVALDLSYSSIVKVKRNQGWPTRRIAIFLASLMSLPLMFLTFLTSTAVPLPTTLAPFVLLCLCLVSATPEKLIERRMVKEIVFEKLKVLDLTACNELTITPDLSASPGLEKLVLDRCDNLVKIHESIALLKKLVLLSMSRCKKLKELPDCIGKLGSLVVLDASNCPKLKEARERERVLEPEGPKVSLSDLLNWMLQSDSQVSNACSVDESVMAQDKRLLEKLYLSGTSIGKLPFSICFLQERLRTLHLNDCKLLAEVPEWIAGLCLLEDLSISNCPSITGLPNAIGSLKKLQSLNLSHCNGIENLPDSVGGLESLTKLLLENTSLVDLPESVGCLGKLKILHLGSCKQLERLPSSIGKLGDLTELILDGTNIDELLPSSIASLQKLQLLSVRGCRRLEHLPTGLREDLTVLREEQQAKKRIK